MKKTILVLSVLLLCVSSVFGVQSSVYTPTKIYGWVEEGHNVRSVDGHLMTFASWAHKGFSHRISDSPEDVLHFCAPSCNYQVDRWGRLRPVFRFGE